MKRLGKDVIMNLSAWARKPLASLGIILILWSLVACSVPPRIVRHEFEEGAKTGEAYARKDAAYIQCWRSSAETDPFQKARSYRTTLEELLKSESFILGFYAGYEAAYRKYLDSHCSP